MALAAVRRMIPSYTNALLALAAAGLLILAFPDFEWWWTAWFALVPLMWAVERETTLQKPARSKGTVSDIASRPELDGSGGSPYFVRASATVRSFLLGWLFGTAFFFGTCWWLTYAPIHYAAVPWPIAYFLILIACLGAGVFPGVFAAILSFLLRRFGSWAFLAAPFVWVFSEFLRYWITGNNWNAIGYSQAFTGNRFLSLASVGGIAIISFLVAAVMPVVQFTFVGIAALGHRLGVVGGAAEQDRDSLFSTVPRSESVYTILVFTAFLISAFILGFLIFSPTTERPRIPVSRVIAIQPDVPMSGIDSGRLEQLRRRQVDLAEAEINRLRTTNNELPSTVVLPESPMNFMYHDDRGFQQFIGDFARRNNVSVLFNSAEPDATNGRYFNSAVMVGPDGKEVAQYDKVYLLPFGEAVPWVLESVVPAFVGNFSYGREYDLLPVGDARAGVMICFESHFGQLSREYVRSGADVIIEMTNDGYLGPTPVLRQHLANAVFRAVETNRPVLRVTNVGITTYITENGTVLDPLPVYQEGTRVWSVSKSDGSQTFYVRYGDWFAWLCTLVTVGLLIFGIRRKRDIAEARP